MKMAANKQEIIAKKNVQDHAQTTELLPVFPNPFKFFFEPTTSMFIFINAIPTIAKAGTRNA
jgi:hypothetical protein|tara:strand:+ start:958 stop:1143 length:186 start_codon:yes stop_codon:yes gene_type:complete